MNAGGLVGLVLAWALQGGWRWRGRRVGEHSIECRHLIDPRLHQFMQQSGKHRAGASERRQIGPNQAVRPTNRRPNAQATPRSRNPTLETPLLCGGLNMPALKGLRYRVKGRSGHPDHPPAVVRGGWTVPVPQRMRRMHYLLSIYCLFIRMGIYGGNTFDRDDGFGHGGARISRPFP